VPHLDVHTVADVLDGSVEPKLISALTEAVVAVYGDWARPIAVVALFGVPRSRWGVGGRATEGTPVAVTLRAREAIFTAVADAEARLVAGVTDAIAAVLGEEVRSEVDVLLVGVPQGRSGVGGEVV
jgi:phenylpyruvate tautomerase PptA (4-oxalocrotonate tautomerase family)